MAASRKKPKSPPSSKELQKWIDAGMCEFEYDEKGQIKQLVVKKDDGTRDVYANMDPLVSVLKKSGLLLGKETAKSVPLKLTPSMRENFKVQAEQAGLPFTEFVRRACFAAQLKPDTLFDPKVEQLEADYKASLRTSRWSKPSPSHENE